MMMIDVYRALIEWPLNHSDNTFLLITDSSRISDKPPLLHGSTLQRQITFLEFSHILIVSKIFPEYTI
jgi:hypothetical protein